MSAGARWNAGPLTDPIGYGAASAAFSTGGAGDATQAQAVDAALSTAGAPTSPVASASVGPARSTGGAGQATDMKTNVTDTVGPALSSTATFAFAGGVAAPPAISFGGGAEVTIFSQRLWHCPRRACVDAA